MFKFFDMMLCFFVSISGILTFVAPFAVERSEPFKWFYLGCLAMSAICGICHSSINNRRENATRLRIMDERTAMRREEIAAGLEATKIGFQRGKLGIYDEL